MNAIEAPAQPATRETWDREYEWVHQIPSSSRTQPSKALILFDQLLPFDEIKTAVDLGCGNGRNSVYLAQRGCKVTAVDYSSVAIRKTKELAAANLLEANIRAIQHDLALGVPAGAESMDLAVDSFVFCHFLAEDFKRHYRDELNRVIRPGGVFFCSVMSVGDEYYRTLQVPESEDLAIDPKNGVAKQLFKLGQLPSYFAPTFQTRYEVALRFEDRVEGLAYVREVLAVVMEKPRH